MADTGLPQTTNGPSNGPVTTLGSVAILCLLLLAGIALGWFVFSSETSSTIVTVTDTPPAEAPIRN